MSIQKLLKTSVAQYVEQVWTGRNESGATPIGDHVLVLPDEAAEKTGGGVYIDPRLQERHTLASETGILVETGEGAFVLSSDRTQPFAGRKPQPGDRVYFTRYAGQLLSGDDGRMYRVMNDNEIGGIKRAE